MVFSLLRFRVQFLVGENKIPKIPKAAQHVQNNNNHQFRIRGFPGSIVVKNLPVNAGDARGMSSITKLGRPLEKEMATHSSILTRRISWTEELGEL